MYFYIKVIHCHLGTIVPPLNPWTLNAPSDSPSCDEKHLERKIPESSKKQNFNLLGTGNYLHSIWYHKGSKSDSKYMGEYAQITCKYAILYKEPEHLQKMVLESIPPAPQILRDECSVNFCREMTIIGSYQLF